MKIHHGMSRYCGSKAHAIYDGKYNSFDISKVDCINCLKTLRVCYKPNSNKGIEVSNRLKVLTSSQK